jgi:segregation and condensation protein A
MIRRQEKTPGAAVVMSDYRVQLDVYNGPLDLLLYLIRRDEININDIPIARITEQYVAHVDMLKDIDPDLAGEFLIMAATLLEIKTRMLLPKPEQAAEGGDAFDPRNELVRQLLEYKSFKDAAGELRTAAAEQAMRFPRRPAEMPEQDSGKDLEDVQIWDLVEAFNALMKAVGGNLRQTEIIYDDTPVELNVADIVDRLGREGDMTFAQIFAGRTRRTEMVGLFLALLELIRRLRVRVVQEATFGQIAVHLRSEEEMAALGPIPGPTSIDAPVTSGTGTPGEEPTTTAVPDAAEPEPATEQETPEEPNGSAPTESV